MKDGGPDSNVTGYWLIEAKSLFSVVLLHFSNGSRDAYHSHAFNAISWVLSGKLQEDNLWAMRQDLYLTTNEYTPSIMPIYTPRSTFYQVVSVGDTWVLSFRGPWASTWLEFIPKTKQFLTLKHGRKIA
jgi:hypothetical protein